MEGSSHHPCLGSSLASVGYTAETIAKVVQDRLLCDHDADADADADESVRQLAASSVPNRY
jgi:hypothetical protein